MRKPHGQLGNTSVHPTGVGGCLLLASPRLALLRAREEEDVGKTAERVGGAARGREAFENLLKEQQEYLAAKLG